MVFKNKHVVSIAIFTALLIFVVSIQAFRYQSWWNDNVSIWVFDVGQGDAIFIDADQNILIDGGPSDVIIEKLSMVLPFWDRSIDYIVNTHPHADHLTGLIDVLNRYLIGEVWVSGQNYETSFHDAFSTSSEDLSSIIVAGHSVELSHDVVATVLWPMSSLDGVRLDDPNDGSIVMLVECFETRMLLTGDIGTNQELAIMERAGDINILKVGHQGGSTSSHIDFLNTIDPEVAIIAVGENDYGHPHAEVIDRLNQVDAEIYRTDLHGDVRIICSPEGYEIKLY
ncbi:MBL fold metallo-hydrolase [Candidatus Uhrbacteria bacterium]|jgi:competence protein ComEC|nr:MBL fold metallo-hydrolase [Candidatus Uhrbacteria bacterium]MBT7717081.1 MBL fold metallo-hydrolase [Candidatus Uhrbacteria bacterium]